MYIYINYIYHIIIYRREIHIYVSLVIVSCIVTRTLTHGSLGLQSWFA